MAEFYSSSSPYSYVENNPILFLDPNGMFKSKFGAWWHKLWNGGDGIGKDKGGEHFVYTDEPNYEEGGVTSSRVFDRNGRSEGKDLEREAQAEDYVENTNFNDWQQDKLDKGTLQGYDNRYDASMSWVSLVATLVMPTPTKALTQIANKAPKTVRFGPKVTNQFNTVKAYKNLESGYTNVVGHGSSLNKMGVDKFIKMLKRRGVSGNLRLFVCGSAKHAQKIANKTGANVLAPKGKVMPTSRGVRFSEGEFILFRPQK